MSGLVLWFYYYADVCRNGILVERYFIVVVMRLDTGRFSLPIKSSDQWCTLEGGRSLGKKKCDVHQKFEPAQQLQRPG